MFFDYNIFNLPDSDQKKLKKTPNNWPDQVDYPD